VSTAVARKQQYSDELNGLQKVAILCMALGAESAAKITQRLTNDEVEAISFEIARMEHVPPGTADEVLAEWVESAMAAGSLTEGGIEYARAMLEKALGPQKAAQVLKRIQSQLADTAGLQRLRTADPQQLGSLFRNEHPQTIALILSHLSAPQTAAVLKELDPALGGEVIFRMARMEKVSPEMLLLIERALGDTDLSIAQGMSSSGGPQAAAAVLNLMSTSLERELMNGVASRDPALADQIKNLMFVFEDISTLDDRAVQRMLREVDGKELALALKASSEELKTRIKGAMSQRAVAALTEEMELLGPVRMRDVEAAQANIIAQIRKLEEAGELVLNGGGTDDVVVG
jgi:flagellar motor switch protein FliG